MGFTEHEYATIRAYVEDIVGIKAEASSLRAERIKYSKTVSAVRAAVERMIDDYGDSGFGDKPEDMCRVVYWLQHLNIERFQ